MDAVARRARGVDARARRVPRGIASRIASGGVASPADISMDSSKLERATGVRACGWELQVKMAAGVPYMPA